MSDKRRRQYVPVSTNLLGSRTGAAILERFGVEGIGAYVALLVAAKRSPIQGEVELIDGREWADIGLAGHHPKWELSELLRMLGQRHLTCRRRVGRTTTVTFRRWDDWNTTPRRDADASRKSRKRASNTADNTAPMRKDSVAVISGEAEGEAEEELLPISNGSTSLVDPLVRAAENAHATERLLEVLSDQDKDTPRVVQSLTTRLSPASVEKVRESVMTQHPISPTRYAVGALKSELRERAVQS